MKIQPKVNAGRSAAIGMLALAIFSAACGATKGTTLAPAGGAGEQIQSSSTSTSGIAGGDAYLMADERYGVAIRAGGGTIPTRNAPVCATADSACLEP